MKLPNEPRKGESVAESVRDIIRYLRAITVTGISGGRVQQTPNGTTLLIKAGTAGGLAGATASVCNFGEIIDVDSGGFTKAIRGGVAYVGDKNFNVPWRGINLASAGVWLIELQIDNESNRDDDGEIILPGILTSAETDPATFWEAVSWSAGPPETQYSDNTNPAASDGLGEIVIPIGKLTVADGVASFEPVACGNITTDQCGGVLSHTRG